MKNTRNVGIVALVIAISLIGARASHAQQTPRAWETAGTFGVGFPTLHDPDEECPVQDCSANSMDWSISAARYLTSNFAVVAAVSGSSFSLNTSLPDFGPAVNDVDDMSLSGFGPAIDLSGRIVTVGGGFRVAGRRAERVSPFAEVLVGYSRFRAKVDVFGFRESESWNGLSVVPAGGIDIAISRRVAIRLRGRYTVDFVDGNVDRWPGSDAGIVFRW